MIQFQMIGIFVRLNRLISSQNLKFSKEFSLHQWMGKTVYFLIIRNFAEFLDQKSKQIKWIPFVLNIMSQ